MAPGAVGKARFLVHGPTISEVRPRLRGVSHHISFYVALVLGAVLVASAGDRRTMVATAVYVFCLAGMFGASALLHRHDWGRARRRGCAGSITR